MLSLQPVRVRDALSPAVHCTQAPPGSPRPRPPAPNTTFSLTDTSWGPTASLVSLLVSGLVPRPASTVLGRIKKGQWTSKHYAK